jgi:hypothetical protein
LWPLLPKYSIEYIEGGDKNRSASELAEMYGEIYKEDLGAYAIGCMLRVLKQKGYVNSTERHIADRYGVTLWWRIEGKDIEHFLR